MITISTLPCLERADNKTDNKTDDKTDNYNFTDIKIDDYNLCLSMSGKSQTLHLSTPLQQQNKNRWELSTYVTQTKLVKYLGSRPADSFLFYALWVATVSPGLPVPTVHHCPC
jgi:hypothetical protein